MNSKNKLIVTLIICGVILFGVVQFVIVPHNNRERQKYMAAQQEPTTQDLKTIIKYKNKYMGNASNTINLFYKLPLGKVPVNFQMYPKKLTLEVNYKDTVVNIGEKKVRKALIYNSTAAFALIDNLQNIEYKFKDNSFTVDRKNVEDFYKNFNNILQRDNWKKQVQKKLDDDSYVNEGFSRLLQTER